MKLLDFEGNGSQDLHVESVGEYDITTRTKRDHWVLDTDGILCTNRINET